MPDVYKRQAMYRLAYSYVRNEEDALDIVPVSYTHLDVYKRQVLR